MISFVIISSLFLFGLATRILGSIKKALNAAIGVERCEVQIPLFEEPPCVPVQEAVRKKTQRSDLNGPVGTTDHAPDTKPAKPVEPSTSVRAPGTATGKPKGTFGGMKAGFLLRPKKPQPKKETAAKADTPKGGEQTPTGQAGQVKVSTSHQKQASPAPRPAPEQKSTHQKPQAAARPDPEATVRQADEEPPRPTVPIFPALAQVRPILLPVLGTNQVQLVWDGSVKARNLLQMIVAARREAEGL